jgi:hypothetical protein
LNSIATLNDIMLAYKLVQVTPLYEVLCALAVVAKPVALPDSNLGFG